MITMIYAIDQFGYTLPLDQQWKMYDQSPQQKVYKVLDPQFWHHANYAWLNYFGREGRTSLDATSWVDAT